MHYAQKTAYFYINWQTTVCYLLYIDSIIHNGNPTFIGRLKDFILLYQYKMIENNFVLKRHMQTILEFMVGIRLLVVTIFEKVRIQKLLHGMQHILILGHH